MATNLDQIPPLAALVEVAHDFHRRGWMVGTAGNLSARTQSHQFWITASGKPKGRLHESDFLLIDIDTGAVVEKAAPEAQPSAETAIHRVIYQLFPAAGACLHVHTVEAVLAARSVAPTAARLPLPALEMIKGLGVWEAEPNANLELFDNLTQVPDIADLIAARFAANAPRLPALMIRDHGVTVWGTSIQQAYDRLECLEFILSAVARGVKGKDSGVS